MRLKDYIYTIGNCSSIPRREASEWRECVQCFFETAPVKVINICDYYTYEDTLHDTDKEIAEFCEREIKRARCVIVNNYLLDKSGGSQREIGLAKAYGIPIFIFDERVNPEFYPWDIEWAERKFIGENALEECCAHVSRYVIDA